MEIYNGKHRIITFALRYGRYMDHMIDMRWTAAMVCVLRRGGFYAPFDAHTSWIVSGSGHARPWFSAQASAGVVFGQGGCLFRYTFKVLV